MRGAEPYVAILRFFEPGITSLRPLALVLRVDLKASVSESAPVFSGVMPEIAASRSVVISAIRSAITLCGEAKSG